MPVACLQPTAELAPRVLLPGDPGRALLLAQALLDEPRMFNHNRGLWGYTGAAPDGAPLTIQSTGVGGPSAALVVGELLGLGATTLVRIGTAAAFAPGLGLGDLVVASSAIADDGASRGLGAGGSVAPDAELTAALAGDHRGPVASVDVGHDAAAGREIAWNDAGVLAVDLQTAAVLQAARRRDARAAAVLAIARCGPPRAPARIAATELTTVAERLGRAALTAV